ncbi:MAG: DUF1780 domain-containing protein [Betaproteobacteria bacterium]|nr:DUF1780 domain-containing protein [Betaproteobacteria bacterium]MDE2187540.1 DUF1780 domain-containing protein [Betaproteobacteria bacterium]
MNSSTLMTNEEFLEDRRCALRESVEYFSAKNKPERERWVCQEFILNLGLAFDETEVITPDDEPPDVVFRDGWFEIKELLDHGRRRHAECKASLQKALQATDPQDLLEQFTPQDITPEQIGGRILKQLETLQDHYAPAARRNLDILFYVNLQEHFLKVGPMPPAIEFAPYGWRSVSAIMGWGALVMFAASDATTFLVSNVGALIQRKFE